MPDMYEYLKNGDIYYALEKCRYERIHYNIDNIIKMLVASHKSIFREMLEFLVNHINEYIVSDTFETLLPIKDCGDKINIMIDFLKKHGLEFMLFRKTGYLLELAIKYNRLDSITTLVNIIKNYKELYKFENCFSEINNLNTFKHIVKKCNINDYIDAHIDDIFYTMLKYDKRYIIMYIIKNYKLFDFNNNYLRYKFNSSYHNIKYYNNIGLGMDMINNI
jgi:hypothetical protein